MITLILGGARSGKSSEARRLAETSGLEPVYIATARALDEEMVERIGRHRAERGAAWRTVEAPLHLAASLRAEASAGRFLVVDCLTLWLANLLGEEGETSEVYATERAALFAALPGLPGDIALVSNEIGWGVVPLGVLSRRFVDEAGWLNQAAARLAGRVLLVAAGCVLPLKGNA